MNATAVQDWAKGVKVNWAAQCSCGHIIFERYLIRLNESEARPFDWCGFCRTRTDLPVVKIPSMVAP